MIAFKVGVEIGRLPALSLILIAMRWWRSTTSLIRRAYSMGNTRNIGSVQLAFAPRLPPSFGWLCRAIRMAVSRAVARQAFLFAATVLGDNV
jgi:hypothetical protein